MRPLILILISCMLPLAAEKSLAQEDDYHGWLRRHLEQNYGVTGGTWTLGSQEGAVLGLVQISSGVTVQSASSSGQPFSRAVGFTVTQPGANPWDRAVRFPIQQPVNNDDVMLLCIWLRHVWPVGELGLVETIFEQTSSPYTKSLSSGYNIPEEWALYLLPFRSVLNHAAGAGRFQLNLGRQRQITEIAGLALINYGSAYSVGDLPTVVPDQSYGGSDPTAAWRTTALQRIEQYRMGDIQVQVLDASGSPVNNADVHVAMTRHGFGFGTAVATGRMIGPGLDTTYRSRLGDLTGDGRGFNIAVLENALKWPPWEADWPVSKNEKVVAVNWLVSQGFDVRGHNLVWPRWQDLPNDIQQNQSDLEYVQNRIRSHIREIAGYPGLKGVVREWDVINEPANVTDLRDVFAGTAGYPTGEEIYADWFRWAAEADPDTRLFINDYRIINAYGPNQNSTARPYLKQLIQDLLDAGVRIDGIGMQGHVGTPLTSIDTLYSVLEDFSQFGLGISISEYDASGVEEGLAASYMRDFLTMVFSHPSVESFLMWGFWDGAHWFDDAPLYRQDWSLKPSGQAFLDLVFDEWWTDQTHTTNAEGMVQVRGFHGEYEITASHDGLEMTTRFELESGGPANVILSLTLTSQEDGPAPDAFRVDPNYPDPFATTSTLQFFLPAARNVRLETYDVLGRLVDLRSVGPSSAGEHSLTINADRLPAGTYYYRLVAGPDQHTGRFHYTP